MAFSKTITSIDIGSYKITCMSGEVGSNETVKINKVATVSSKGIKNGIISDVLLAKDSITRCVDQLEKKQGSRIKNVFVTMSGLKPHCHNIQEKIKISSKRVSQKDINKLLNICNKKIQNEEKTLLHAVPMSYFVDNNPTENPIGIIGNELAIRITMTVCDALVIQNIKGLLESCDIDIKDIAFDGYVSAIGTLDDDEKDLCCGIINIGGGITSVSVLYKGKFISCINFNYAGDNITNDIMITTAASKIEAERIKIKHAHAVLNNSIAIQRPIEFHPAGEKNNAPSTITTTVITDIVKHRLEEIFDLCKEKTPYFKTVNRIILTGGSAQIENIAELCRIHLSLPTRIGNPNNTINLPNDYKTSLYTTAIGLIRYSGGPRPDEEIDLMKKGDNIEHSIVKRFYNWLKTEI